MQFKERMVMLDSTNSIMWIGAKYSFENPRVNIDVQDYLRSNSKPVYGTLGFSVK